MNMHVLLVTLIALSISTGKAEAQEPGNPSRGLAIAQRLCAQRHAVQKEQLRSLNEAAPPFQVIAAIPGMTGIALSMALNTPHRTMPNITLEANDRADIVAHILSLK